MTKRTKLVAVAAVSNVLGTINPLAEIIRRAHDAGAVVLVDGAQSVPHQPTDVQALDCDFLAFSGHKMLGPSGVGVLYGKRELLEAMPPFMGGGGMIAEVTLEGFEPLYLPGKFEAGTPPIVPAVALAAAIDYLNAVGLDAIAEHERRLTHRAHEVLEAVGGVRIIGPAPEHKARDRQLRVRVRTPHAHDVAQVLDRLRRGDPRRPPLRHAAAPAVRRVRHGPGELLLLQHAGRGRQARRGAGRREAGAVLGVYFSSTIPAPLTPPKSSLPCGRR